jgi:hypothetical protein
MHGSHDEASGEEFHMVGKKNEMFGFVRSKFKLRNYHTWTCHICYNLWVHLNVSGLADGHPILATCTCLKPQRARALQSGRIRNIIPSWPDPLGSSSVMLKTTMDWIWSEYTTSPDPAAGMQSLNQMCSTLTKHVLLPTHIVLSHGSFSLCPDLAQVLINVVPQLGHFLNLARRDAGLSDIHNFCHAELQVLISSTGSDIATQNQVVWNWVHLIDKVYITMVDMKSLWRGHPIHILGSTRPS